MPCTKRTCHRPGHLLLWSVLTCRQHLQKDLLLQENTDPLLSSPVFWHALDSRYLLHDSGSTQSHNACSRCTWYDQFLSSALLILQFQCLQGLWRRLAFLVPPSQMIIFRNHFTYPADLSFSRPVGNGFFGEPVREGVV